MTIHTHKKILKKKCQAQERRYELISEKNCF